MDERARLRRLRLIGRLREVEHRELAARLFAEMGNERRARSVADRTVTLLEHYSARRDACDGLDLTLQREMARRTRQMHASASAHLAGLVQQTEQAMQQERAARRRRDRIQELADQAARSLATPRDTAAQIRQRAGTVLDEPGK